MTHVPATETVSFASEDETLENGVTERDEQIVKTQNLKAVHISDLNRTV